MAHRKLRSIALPVARTATQDLIGVARFAIVAGSAAALILAGHALPF